MSTTHEFMCSVDLLGRIKWPSITAKTLAGKEVVVKLSKAAKRRSDAQNRYMWGILIPAVQKAMREEGSIYTPEEVHDIMKESLGHYKVVEYHGQRFKILERTKSLSTEEFCSYVDTYRAWAEENLHIYIPLPMEAP